MADKRYGCGWARLALAAVAVSFVGCGGTDPTPVKREIGSGSVQLTDPATAAETTSGQITADAGLVPMTLSTTGELEVRVDWGSSSDNVDIGIIKGACAVNQLIAHQCPDPYVSSTSHSKPETLRTNVSSGSYTLLMVNFGPGAENVSYKVYMTPSE